MKYFSVFIPNAENMDQKYSAYGHFSRSESLICTSDKEHTMLCGFNEIKAPNAILNTLTFFISFYVLFKNTPQQKFLSYRNQSTELSSKSVDCFYVIQDFTEWNFRLDYSLTFVSRHQSRLWKLRKHPLSAAL